MASAVFRIKRRIDDEPFDKFVVSCKRPKLADEATASQTDSTASDPSGRTILKLAGTVQAGDDIGAHLSRLQKADAEQCVRKLRKPSNVLAKLRQQLQNDAQQQRYKILSDFRAGDADGPDDSGRLTVIDVVKEGEGAAARPAAEVAGEIDRFVYDLYTVDSGEAPISWDIEHIDSIVPFDDVGYQFDQTFDNSDIDSEDSNDEANWRNDYPDTDDGASVGDDDMRRAVEDLNFHSDALSSDDEAGDERVVHFIDQADDDDAEYEYFRKHGRVKSHTEFYRLRGRRAAADSDESSADDSDADATKSSGSDVSELFSCNEDDD